MEMVNGHRPCSSFMRNVFATDVFTTSSLSGGWLTQLDYAVARSALMMEEMARCSFSAPS